MKRFFSIYPVVCFALIGSVLALPALSQIPNPIAKKPEVAAITTAHGAIDWDAENKYWRETYTTRPYYTRAHGYDTYEPAYRYGVDIYSQSPDTRFDDLDQAKLRTGWQRAHGTSKMSWENARSASRDAYNRLYERNRKTGN